MNKIIIEKEYKKKIQLLNKYNQAYYNENKPIIDDAGYDELKHQIILLEKKFKFLKNQYSPSLSVGFKPSKNFKKEFHKVPMLSLGNAFSENDLINFEKKILNYINDFKFKDMEYSVEPKIDGICDSLIYNDGLFI